MASPRSSGTAGRDSPNPSFNEPFQFDEQKLLSNAANPEKQELYVFNWLANLERELKRADKEAVKTVQTNLEKQLLKFMSFTSPKPSRPVRQLISRCFVIIYIKGDSRTLFDTITTLQSFVNAGKGASEKEKKLAALHCIGVIMKSIGDRILSLLPETINICLKTTKNTANVSIKEPLIIRLEAINTITRALEGAAKGATELLVKDIMKQLKAGLNDKALIIKDATIKCMHSVAKYTHQLYPITANELDQLLSQMVRVLDGSNQTIRRSVAAYISTLLAGTQGEVDFLASSTPTKNKTSTTSHPSTHSSQTPGSPTLSSSPDPVKVVLSVEEMLSHLSTIYNKQSTAREVRSAIVEAYSALFIKLGTNYVELNYAEIAQHLLKELVSHPKNLNSRYDTLNVREHCGLLLRDVIGTRLLSEQGQVTAVRELVQNWVKQWPALTHNQVEPTKLSLVCAVNEISGLLLDLGGAASTVSDVLVDPLINLLSHPSYSVQIAAAWCLRCLCYSLPVKLSELITKVLSFVNKDLNNLTTPTISSDLPKRALGHAYGLAALLSVVPARPLYVSFELSARVFSISTQLIKSSTNKDVAIASIHLQVAWILIGSLMCLGPNFVKLHLPQLLLLWKTALPKPISKDFVSNRTESEVAFMLHVRECVLGAMLSCVLHNSKLITPDVAKRLVALLSNTLAFSTLVGTTFHNVNTQSNSTTSVAQQLPSTSLKFSDREIILKRRILQCFVAIRPTSSYDNLSSQLLKMCLSNFADPEKNIGSAITAAIAAVSGSFTSVWTTGDEYAYGVSSKLQGMTVDIANAIDGDQGKNSRGVAIKDWLNRDLIESRLENQLEQPIIGAPEYDSIMIYTTYWISPANSVTYQIPKPVPAVSALVDYSIELFALIFPLQSALVQESYLEQLIKAVRHPKLEKSPGRKMALQVNMVICLLTIFKNIMHVSGKKGESSVPSIADKKVGALAMELLQEAIVHPDAYLRHAASDALGRLLSVVGGNMVPTQMQLLVDQVVNNRDPDTRAGSALALGSIYSHVGGMAAGGHLKTLIGILLSLSSDPHPIVHFWALHALAKIIDSAGPMFSQYVSSTLGIIAKLYMADTHEPCGGTVGTTNVGLGLSAYQQFGKIIYGLIGTLGPELQTNSKVRNLCLNLVIELRNDDDQFVVVESIRCLQHFIMLAQQYVDLPRLVAFLQFQFSSMHFPLKEVAITCLYQLVQRNAKHVFEIAAPGLDNQLFSLLDTDPKIDGVKDIVKSWLSQTALESPSSWVELCRKVMSKTGSVASAGAPIEPPTLDITGGDEDEGFGIEQSSGVNVTAQRRRSLEKKTHLSSDTVQIPPRWRTQLFALQCLHQVVQIIHASGDKDQFDLSIAKKGKQAGKDYLVLKVAELIKMAFTASTAVVGEMRLEGLTLLRDVIEKFSATPDPDFEEAALLEQYQVCAALTPAFTADSSPEILSAAVKVCAVFVGSGIVKELHRMGRILKLLTTALENCKDNSSVTKVGDFKDLSPHAAIMVKLSVLNAWAELQVASTKQTYLVQVVQPNLPLLCPLWILTLKEYARVQVDPDITDAQANVIGTGSMQNTSQTEVFDSMYSGLTREVILTYYNMSWLTILGAIASLVQKENPYIILALNGEEITIDDNTNDISKYGDDEFDDFGDDNNEFSDDFSAFSHEKEPELKKDPAKYFFILFGLCVEALSNTFGGSSRSSGVGNNVGNNVETQKIVRTCIDALKAFLRPVVAGNTFLDEYIFIELINLFDRLILTEGFKVQYDIIQIIGNIIKDFGAAYICKDVPKNSMKINGHSEDEATIEFTETETILFHILRLLVNIFFQKIPSLSNRPEVVRVFRLPQGNARGQTSQETIVLLKFTIDAFTSLITIVPSKYKIDLSAIAFYVYISIIQDPKFQSELVPHVLINIKLLCENISAHLEEEEFYTFSRVVHSTISSTLLQINSLTKSQDALKDDEVSVVKNSLLTSTILFTSCPKQCTENTAIQTEFMEILKNGFYSDIDSIAITSFQCTRTLILLSAKKETNIVATTSSQMRHVFIKTLIPEVAAFLQKIKDTYGAECTSQESSYKLDAVEESIKTLLITNTISQDSHKTALMAVTLPTLIQLLADPPLEKYMSSSEETNYLHTLPPLHTLSVTHILSLAGSQPQNFRDAVAVLLPGPKAKLEAAIRFNVFQQQQQQKRLQEERDRRYNERIELNKGPSISLKSDFSGFA
ncbi:21017_t:CDS:10 [Cetraspora pellucida]|uniref:21017_t:CDS:1 n=1 Tax=Cetraspora pellucida TaxID=1433469 RepID=A0A9N9BPY2_9GLOM|nr:21017_t:CDS:10 [Cetraspora pellucida]